MSAPLNGGRLIAALPGSGYGTVVCVHWRDEYVTAWVDELTDESWAHGNYFHDRDEALADMQRRAAR